MAAQGIPGVVAPREALTDVDTLVDAYYARQPDLDDPRQLVSFGTSGHRGTSTDGTFNEPHIAAITQAICEYRREQQCGGPLFLGKDTHALSHAAQQTALEVLAANGVQTVIQQHDGFTPTPVISRHILVHNRTRSSASGGRDRNYPVPQSTAGRRVQIQRAARWTGRYRSDELDSGSCQSAAASGPRHPPHEPPLVRDAAACVQATDLIGPYVEDLAQVLDFDVIRSAGLNLAVDPLGGAAVGYWIPIQERYSMDLTIVNDRVDPQFSFMPLDHDGKIRMDCSSPYAMANLVQLKDKFDVAFGNDPDADRHGIVTRSVGLMNPNHYLAVAIRYLFTHRPRWSPQLAIGKTAVSSGIIDRVAHVARPARASKCPWGSSGLSTGCFSGQYGFAGEESAGASFLCQDGSVWTTDKDGLILGLLAAEITARTGRDPGEHFAEITSQFGRPCYRRLDAPADGRQKAILKNLSPEQVAASTLAGDRIVDKLTVRRAIRPRWAD